MKKKKIVLPALLLLILSVSCSKTEIVNKVDEVVDEEIPFGGSWKHQFEAGPGNLHTARYFVYKDSIRYTLKGNVGNSDYLIKKDKFQSKDNRFIGHTNLNKFYLIFVKEIKEKSLKLYKQEIENIEEGLQIKIPSDTTTENHGWNTYLKE